MSRTPDDKGRYLAQFVDLERSAAARTAPWLQRIREAAIARFEELGFPTVRQEEWRFTNVEPIARTPFVRPAPGADGLRSGDVERLGLAGQGVPTLVFVNGRFAPSLSSAASAPRGVRAASLAEALKSEPGRVEPHLARHASPKDHPFVALNTAFVEDGAFVEIAPGAEVREPIHILFLTRASGESIVTHPRVLVVAGEGSRATLLETFAGRDGETYFTNAVSEILAGRNAVVDHYRIQRESPAAFHVSTFQARLDRDASFSTHAVSVGGVLVRNDVNAVLDGEGAECVLNGLFLAHGEQHVDNHTRIEHARPHGSSRELYKGILAGRSRGVFNGRIVVHPGAQKTDAKQTNKNILLSEDALMDSNPQLEIYADDVKCTHGSTIGQIDDDAIFYLRSRGVGREAARSILVHAFASDIVGRVKVEPLRARLECAVHTWLSEGRAVLEAA